MQTSPKGIAYLELAEGTVLKAYRDAVGVWTIGAGLTAASGVVTPKAGMVITRGESSNLLQMALRRNYEPRVTAAIGRCKQHVFDGSVSFDFNTGAINRASWVKALLAHDMGKVRSGLAAWKKGGGKVLPGLVRRRAEEADIIILDKWPAGLKDIPARQPTVAHAAIVIALTPEEVQQVADAFRSLGYDPGNNEGRIRLEAVTAFQKKYDLTVDGKIGRATLSTLQRELDARRLTKNGAGTGAAGGAVVTGNEVVTPPAGNAPGAELIGDPAITWIGIGVGTLAALYIAYLAWHYRDLIAARVQSATPRLAGWLRSF